jgi:hypothetical protein
MKTTRTGSGLDEFQTPKGLKSTTNQKVVGTANQNVHLIIIETGQHPGVNR